ncbi:class I SAM-dependent methyltransferase [Geomonas sp.]|uniref:class I SAM-dependent DNA methyltransferase n=1 Tax=Geomonas sp. TaxID=2651584 RepID=UPI002B489F80|nr:class I SAM-dependent methyltransferase [Geomonas sp.]HJV36975.1 class I SAM-dependent methyltransferase [Geomonas sp.]
MVKEGRRDFDAVAQQWDQEPRRQKLAEDVVAAIRKEVPLSKEMNALDYGCGSGLVTLGLRPYVKSITGADSSQGMLDVLNAKIRQGELGNVETRLLDLEERVNLRRRYDLIVSSMTMHHVDDVAALIGALSDGLRRGGWLAIADLKAEDGSFHDNPTGVLHAGFEPSFLKSVFESCGLSTVRVVTAAVVDKSNDRHNQVLLCVGRKEG